MPEVSYIRHDDLDGATPKAKLGGKLKQEQQQRDEFDTEDGFLAFALAIYNLLIVSNR